MSQFRVSGGGKSACYDEAVKAEILVNRFSLIAEFALFLRENKKLWLLPVFVVLAMVGALLVIVEGSALSPFIYTVF